MLSPSSSPLSPIGSVACAISRSCSSVASMRTISSVSRPSWTTRYGVVTKPYSEIPAEALTDHTLHPVQADPERFLDQLTDGAQATVAEMLVLVQVLFHGLARTAQRLRRVVLEVLVELLGDAEDGGEPHELADERQDVV